MLQKLNNGPIEVHSRDSTVLRDFVRAPSVRQQQYYELNRIPPIPTVSYDFAATQKEENEDVSMMRNKNLLSILWTVHHFQTQPVPASEYIYIYIYICEEWQKHPQRPTTSGTTRR